jgi:hypothetical protein
MNWLSNLNSLWSLIFFLCPFYPLVHFLLFSFFLFFLFVFVFWVFIYKKKSNDNVNSMRKINGCVNNECIENKCFNLRFFQKDIEMMWKHKKSTFFCFFLHFFISIYFGKIFLKKRSKLSYEIIYETIKAIKGHSFP